MYHIQYGVVVKRSGKEELNWKEDGLPGSRSGRTQGKIGIDMRDNFLLYGKKLSFHLRREGMFHTAVLKDVKPGKVTNDDL